MTLDTNAPVGQIATEHPLATRVFARHGIDFCCGGGKPLSEAVAALGLDAEAVLAEIETEIAAGPATPEAWDKAPLPALLDHILETHHQRLWEELPRLETMARKVHRVHGDKAPETLSVLLRTYLGLKAELEDHMGKEEDVLFPMVRAGMGAHAQGPVTVMRHEHDRAGEALRHLRAITDDYTVPADACNTWRALWHGLAALEEDLHMHIHLENNVLFPRALAGTPAT